MTPPVLSKHQVNELISHTGATQWGSVEDPIPHSFERYKNWVKSSRHQPLGYLSDHRLDIRGNLKSFFPEFKQAIVLLFSYSSTRKQMQTLYENPNWNGWKVASYASGFEGVDYHHFIGAKLDELGQSLKAHYPSLKFQRCLDVHPVLERDLAYRAGLGWFGRNSMLIHQKEGSFVMIGSLLLSERIVDAENNNIEADHCGTCTACVDRCPTLAIDGEKREIIADQCISTFTIELFQDAKPIPGHVERGEGEIFGCDLCQDVCPWNKRPLNQDIQKKINPEWLEDLLLRPKELVIKDIESQSERGFRKKMQGSVFERLGRKGLLKNLKLLR